MSNLSLWCSGSAYVVERWRGINCWIYPRVDESHLIATVQLRIEA